MSANAERTPSQRRRKPLRWLAHGRVDLPHRSAPLHRRPDALDDLDLDQDPGSRRIQFPPKWFPDEPPSRTTNAARSAEQRRPHFLRFFWNSLFVSTAHHDPRGGRGGAGGLRLLALQFPGQERPVLRRAAAQHVPGGDLPHPALHPDAQSGSGEHAWLADPHLSHLRSAASIWLLKGFYDNIPVQLEQAARIDGATRFQAFLLIVMPLSTPGIIATAIYSFIWPGTNTSTPDVPQPRTTS